MADRTYRARLTGWAREGVEGMRPLLWPTLQTAVAAGVAWELCVRVLGHPRPIFAPIVAIVAMGFTSGQRGRAAVLLVVGVAIGIGIGDVLVRVLDRGGIEVTVVVFVAMTLTLFLTREPLVVVQAGISAALLVGVDRQTDAQCRRFPSLDEPADLAAVLVPDHEHGYFGRRSRSASLRLVHHVAGEADDDEHCRGAGFVGAPHGAERQCGVAAAAGIWKAVQHDGLALDVTVGEVRNGTHADPDRLEVEGTARGH